MLLKFLYLSTRFKPPVAFIMSSRFLLLFLVSRGLAVGNISCPALPSTWPTWSAFTPQTTLPDPFQPPISLISPGVPRVQNPEEWYSCQQAQLLTMLQEYQYGYYPDHAEETVSATRSGNTISITVTAREKSGKFGATLALPAGSGPFPVVINIGGMNTQPYLQRGIAIAEFNYLDVAPDSNLKTGAFWSLYNGRDIGTSHPFAAVSN